MGSVATDTFLGERPTRTFRDCALTPHEWALEKGPHMARTRRASSDESEECCPSWCVAEHDYQGELHQRWHFSSCRELALSELTRPSGMEGPGVEVALAFDVCLERPWGVDTTYVLVGVGAEQARTFCLTIESAERLAMAMCEVASTARLRA